MKISQPIRCLYWARALGAALVLCASPLLAQEETAMVGLRYGTWRGFVVDKTFGKPLTDVLVRLLDMNGNELGRMRTDELGRYLFPARSGPAMVQACVPGRRVVDRIAVGRSPERDLVLKPIAVDPRAELPVYFVGRDAVSGERLEDLEVTFRSRRDGATLLTGRTDADGVFRGVLRDPRYGSTAGFTVSMARKGYFPKTFEVPAEDIALLMGELAGSMGPVLEPMDTTDAHIAPPVLRIK